MRALSLITMMACLLAAPAALAADATFTVKHLTPETALKAAQKAMETCRTNGYQVGVAVVDRSGVTQVVLRDRIAGPHTVEIATNKAWTAVSMRTDTLSLAKVSDAGGASSGVRQFPRVVAVGGGVPIEGGGTMLGAIGVSGAPGGEADDVCAKAGIAAIQDDLDF
ncbi:MAG: heme-binding protein [Ferrovibrio sp.]